MDKRDYDIPEDWLNRIGGHDSSGWLGAFVLSPKKAVADLLWDQFYFGPLNLTDRRQIITTWLDLIGNSESFAETLDRELTAWVKENWGRFERPAHLLASAWSCVCHIVEISARLSKESALPFCARELREHFEEYTEFLGSFSTAPAADPSGAYLAAIAEYQADDRSLLRFWYKLCELPDGVPFYHAQYAILGLRRIRSSVPSLNGTLRTEVVRGLIKLAASFDRLANERKLQDDVARDMFRRIGRQTLAGYGDSKGWAIYGVRAALDLSDRAQSWLTVIPPLARAVQQEKEKIQHGEARLLMETDPGWTGRAREIGNSLAAGDRTFLPKARILLDEQRRYAEATGNTYYIVRSLAFFANGVKGINSQLALRWAAEALQWDPYNHYCWTTIRTVLLVQNRVEEATQFAWVAWKRFPQNVEVHNALADVLNAGRRFYEAEFIYRQAIDRFPDNIRARNGLAATLGRLGKFSENEQEYIRTIEAGLANATTYVGLALLVFERGDIAQAKAHAERALELDPNLSYAQKLLRKINDEPEEITQDVDDWSEIPEVVSELSTFPTIETGGESFELEPEERLVEITKEPVRPPYKLKERKTKGATEPKPKAAQPKLEATEQKPEATEPKPKATEPKVEANKPEPVDTHLAKEPEKAEAPAGEDDLKELYQFKPARGIVIAALVAEGYFYRNWAKTVKGELSAQRRRVARTVLKRAEDLSPQNADVLAERAALIADEGDLTSARETLIDATEITHPAVVSLQVLRARVDREIARKENRRLTEVTLDELCLVPLRLRERDSSFPPLFYYQKGLAALALLDGDNRRKVAADSFSSFRRKLNQLAEAKADAAGPFDKDARMEPRRFYEWLEDHVNNRVFDGLPEPKEVSPADINILDERWNERRAVVDEVEDFIVSHITLGQISAELFAS